MITYSIIQKSQLEGALRLDAEYYQPEYLEIISKIKSQKSKILFRDLVEKIIHPKEIKREYSDSGYIFLLAQNVKPGFLDFSEKRYFSEEVAKTMPQNLLRKGDLLFVRTGAIGDVTVYLGEPTQVLASAHILIARPNFKISPYYLMVFFNTDTGKKLIIRGTYGALQPEIAPDYLKIIPVPVVDKKIEKEIEQVIFNSNESLKQSEFFYSQAENLLLEELGLKDFKIEDDLSYIVNLSEIKSAQRADAEYFQPKYEKIFDYIKVPIKKLKEITTFLNHAKQPPYIDGGEIPIITQKHLGKAFLNLEAINDPETKFTSLDWLKKYSKYKLRIGDILYYSVGAYIGKTNIVFEDLNATAASFITIIRPIEEVNPIYLTVVLNSVVGQLQSEKWQSATAQQYIYPKDIGNFKIPLLPKPTQQKIADLVQKSHSARKKAKELLEEAKRKVEKLIEK